MKKILFALSFVSLMLLSGACLEMNDIHEGPGSLTISVMTGIDTKASATDVLAAEKKLKRLDVFLFQSSSGSWAFLNHVAVDPVASDAGYVSGTNTWSKTYSDLSIADYKVIVVANCSAVASLTTEAAIKAVAINLEDNDLAGTNGFHMYGETTTSVSGSSNSATVSLERFVSRVRLVNVTNQVPSTFANSGAITVKAAFLENVYCDWTLTGTGTPGTWVNLCGRKSGSQTSTTRADYIDTESEVNPSAVKSYVWQAYNANVANAGNMGAAGTTANRMFYCYPNPANNVSNDDTGAYDGGTLVPLARLVILATVNGTDYWYPVTLVKNGTAIQRNYSYDVSVTIKGTGSDDPNKPVSKGNLTATVSVSAWGAGAEYTEEI